MKIAVPINEKNRDSEVCESFGRSLYFLIYDTETKENHFIENNSAGSQGGAGIKAAQTIADSKSEILITPRCGENAAEVIAAAGIGLYQMAAGSAMDNVNAFLRGELFPLSEIHPGFHHHGNG